MNVKICVSKSLKKKIYVKNIHEEIGKKLNVQ